MIETESRALITRREGRPDVVVLITAVIRYFYNGTLFVTVVI